MDTIQIDHVSLAIAIAFETAFLIITFFIIELAFRLEFPNRIHILFRHDSSLEQLDLNVISGIVADEEAGEYYHDGREARDEAEEYQGGTNEGLEFLEDADAALVEGAGFGQACSYA